MALGAGTAIGYKRIVVTVAEKIGKAHMTYAQGAAAELVAAITIGLADGLHMPVSTTHVLSSGVAGTMWANRSGIQGANCSQDRTGVGLYSARGNPALRRALQPGRAAHPWHRAPDPVNLVYVS